MRSTMKNSVIIGATLFLAACGGGGGADGSGGGADEPSALFFGSTDPAASRSGLDYADGTQDRDDLIGQTLTVRVTRTVTNINTGESQQITTDEMLTLLAEDAIGAAAQFSLSLDGETLLFDTDGSRPVADRGDGSSINGFEGFIFLNEDLQFVRLLELSAFESGVQDDQTLTGRFITGFETNPDFIAIETGFVEYVGEIEVSYPNIDATGFELAGGSFLLNADFGAGTVGGRFNLESFDTDNNDGEIELRLAPTTITGNGFNGDLTVDSCTFDACTSNTEIGGVFFGPQAEEVAGLVNLDVTITDDGIAERIIGSGAFGGQAAASD